MASRKAYRQTSKRPAAPMPPPMHIVTCVSKDNQRTTTTNKKQPRKEALGNVLDIFRHRSGQKWVNNPSVKGRLRHRAFITEGETLLRTTTCFAFRRWPSKSI